MRIQVILDDVLGSELQAKATKLGYTVSSLARQLIKKSLHNKKLTQLELSMLEEPEKISLEDFKKQLKELY